MMNYHYNRLIARNFLAALFAFVLFSPFISHAKAAPLSAQCRPVEGNESFFGGKPVFNTFYGRPVPLTFALSGDKAKLKAPALVLYIPKSIKLREAFQSYPFHQKDITYSMAQKAITRDGQAYYRYQTTDDITDDIPSIFGWDTKKNPTGREFQITVALDAPESVTSGEIYWAVENNGTELNEKHFSVRFHQPLPIPPDDKRGQFRIMTWDVLTQLDYHDPALQKAGADLLLASNIRDIQGIRNAQTRWGEVDTYRASHGINVMFWPPLLFNGAGPLKASYWKDSLKDHLDDHQIPWTVMANGEQSKTYASPIAVLQREDIHKGIIAQLRKFIEDKPKVNYLLMDYEPWFYKEFGFDPITLKAFRERYSISEPLTPDIILQKYQQQWAEFWVDLSTQLTELMARSVHAIDPHIKTISYSYFHDYEIKPPDDQWKQFSGAAKDPRQEASFVDELMFSAYSYTGRDLIDNVRMSQRHIPNADISIIGALAREGVDKWVRKGYALSPQRIYQEAVLCAALGIKRYGLYPGTYIDGAFYQELNRASTLVWAHEDYYFRSIDVHQQTAVSVTTAAGNPAKRSDYFYTAQEAHGKVLLSMFNFSNENLRFAVQMNNSSQQDIIVPPYDVKLLERPGEALKLNANTAIAAALRIGAGSANDIDLTGEWRFLPDAAKNQAVTSAKYDDRKWQVINADKQWQLQGVKYHGVAWYRKSIQIPLIPKEQKVSLSFGGIDGSAKIYLNGKEIGEHVVGSAPDYKGWDEPFEFDITNELKAGENIIAIRVASKSNNTGSGIFRPVRLTVRLAG